MKAGMPQRIKKFLKGKMQMPQSIPKLPLDFFLVQQQTRRVAFLRPALLQPRQSKFRKMIQRQVGLKLGPLEFNFGQQTVIV